jgi:general secretion pathway protein L
MNMREFLDWWFAQLRSLIPAEWLGFLKRNEPAMGIAIDGGMVKITTPSGEDSVMYGLATLDPFRDRGLAHQDLPRSAGAPPRIRLTLSPNNYLVRNVTVPRAARAHFAETVGYQISTLTPFTSDAVLYACGEQPNGAIEGGAIPGWLVVVPLQPVLQALSAIDQPPPENPLNLTAPPRSGEHLEISWRVANTESRQHTGRRFVWLGLALVWSVAIGLHFYTRDNHYAMLEQQLADLRAEAGDVVALRSDLDASVERLRWIQERKQAAFPRVEMLNTLAELLDDDSWLQRLDFDGKNLTLTGLSKTPSTLIGTLESSDMLEAVRFDALTRDRRTNADRFNLSAKLQPAQVAEGG